MGRQGLTSWTKTASHCTFVSDFARFNFNSVNPGFFAPGHYGIISKFKRCSEQLFSIQGNRLYHFTIKLVKTLKQNKNKILKNNFKAKIAIRMNPNRSKAYDSLPKSSIYRYVILNNRCLLSKYFFYYIICTVI